MYRLALILWSWTLAKCTPHASLELSSCSARARDGGVPSSCSLPSHAALDKDISIFIQSDYSVQEQLLDIENGPPALVAATADTKAPFEESPLSTNRAGAHQDLPANSDQKDRAFLQSSAFERRDPSTPVHAHERDAGQLGGGYLSRTAFQLNSSENGVTPVYAMNIAKDEGLDAWTRRDTVMLSAVLLFFLCFDIFVAPRLAYNATNHLFVFCFMFSVSVFYGWLVWAMRGRSDGLAWATGYVVEMALSTDNLFIFHMVFRAFSVPADQTSFALSVGIYGAICFRIIFIISLTALFQLNYIVDVIVGLVLILSGVLAVYDDDENEDVNELYTVRFFKWMLGSRLQDKYCEEGRLFVKGEDGRTQMTVLFLVVCVVSVVDVFFAVDSVGSKTGQVKNLYINLSSCLLAMLSLRALFFIVRDAADHFDYVKYGICAILCFVGLEMIFSKWVELPLGHMCVIIVMLFTASVLASIAKARHASASKA